MQLTRSKGLHKPDPDKAAHRKPLLAMARFASGTPRGSAMLERADFADQGQSSTCFWHSLAWCIWCALRALGVLSPILASPRLGASLTYSRVRKNTTTPGGDFPMLIDTGADLSDASAVGAEWGVAPMIGPTSDGRNSDIENMGQNGVPLIAGGQFPEPDTRLIQEGASTLISGEYSIPIGSDTALAMALCLDAGVPIWTGGPVAQPFEDLGPSQVATAADVVNGSGHAMYVRGYRMIGPAFQFLIVSSWGSWGERWVDESFVQTFWQAWPMAVKVSS